MQLLVWIAIVYGLSQILSEMSISKPLRIWLIERSHKNKFYEFLAKLLSCFICTSVWISMIMTFLYNPTLAYFGFDCLIVAIILNGYIGSAVSWWIHEIIEHK